MEYRPKEECIICGSPGDARSIMQELAQRGIIAKTVPVQKSDRVKFGNSAVELNVQGVPIRKIEEAIENIL